VATQTAPQPVKVAPTTTPSAPSRMQSEGKAGSLARYPFPTEYGDHFETPLVAYKHLEPFLYCLAKRHGGKEGMRIYDPYYCQGAVVGHLNGLGFMSVTNSNRDFYADVESGAVPEFDCLVTNPPFSGDHKVRDRPVLGRSCAMGSHVVSSHWRGRSGASSTV
jgi:hypothetical protein